VAIDPETLKAGLTEEARQATPLDMNTAELRQRIHRRRRNTATGALASCIAVAAVAIGGFAVAGGVGQHNAAAERYSSPAPVPPGMKSLSYHGVEFAAPASWPINATRCGTAIRETVIMPVTAMPACLIKPTAFDLIEASDTKHGTLQSAAGAKRVSFFGHVAFSGDRRLTDGRTEAFLSIPDLDVKVVAQTHRPELAQKLIAAVRPARPADSLHCVDPIPALRPQRPPKPLGQLAPAGFMSAALCVYDGLRVVRSTQLNSTDAAMLAGTLNALKPGLQKRGAVNKPPKKPASQPCTPADQAAFNSGYLLRLSYPDHRVAEVVVRVSGCRDLGASNGDRTGRLTTTLVDTLGKVSGYPMIGTPVDDLIPQ